MPRLIDANKIVYSWVIDNDGEEHDGITLQSIIDKMPTVDPVKHGHWIEKDDECECPFCGKAWNYIDNCTETFNYCPHCGTKMDEVTEEQGEKT